MQGALPIHRHSFAQFPVARFGQLDRIAFDNAVGRTGHHVTLMTGGPRAWVIGSGHRRPAQEKGGPGFLDASDLELAKPSASGCVVMICICFLLFCAIR
jgi:hypothetical protein